MLQRMTWLIAVLLSLLAGNGLAASAMLLEQSGSFPGWQFRNEAQTAGFVRDGRLFLGGAGSNGERCAITRSDLGQIDNWQLLVGLGWSHNNAVGGHPTNIDVTMADGKGYRLALTNKSMELFKLSGGDQAVSMGKAVLPPRDLTQPVNVWFSRIADGKISAGIENSSVTLSTNDTDFRKFSNLTISYGVFRHGYAAMVDKVFCKTERNDNATSPVLPVAAWRHPQVKIGVLDFDFAKEPFCRTEWGGQTVKAWSAQGCRAEVIAAGELAGRKDQYDVLVVNPGVLAADDLRPLVDFLRAGKAVWLVGAPMPGDNLWVKQQNQWKAIDKKEWPEEGKKLMQRLAERLLGATAVASVASGMKVSPELTVTAAGKQAWGFAPAAIQIGAWSFLPWNDSIARQSLPPWVARELLITCRYEKKNWVQRKDNFTGIVAELMRHGGGEFAGARVLFTGLPLTGGSLMNSANREFAAWSLPLLNTLADANKVKAQTVVAAGPAVPELTRQNFFTYPGGVMAPLCFRGTDYVTDEIFYEDLAAGGFSACQFAVSWINDIDANGSVVDWQKMDAIMKTGTKIIFDPYHFRWHDLKWSNSRSLHDPVFKARFLAAMTAVATRYRDNANLVAMMVTPHTHTYNYAVDTSAEGREAWRRYLQEIRKFTLEALTARYHRPVTSWEQLPLPEVDSNSKYNVGPLWHDYWQFHSAAYHKFIGDVIRSVRAVVPEMPLILRGPYLEVGINMAIAAEFKNVACHCECVETTIDTEGYFRSLSKRFNLPAGSENGWPKPSAAALKMALADYLMGDYQEFLYSFGGPRWARGEYQDLREAVELRRQMGEARYPRASLGILIADTTLWCSRPPSFFSLEKLPHLEGTMERLGFYFEGVSAAFPRLSGLDVVLDDGSNTVITPELREELSGWVRQGGTLIMFPHSGTVIADGSSVTLAKSLGVNPAAGNYRVGNGKVIVLERIPEKDPGVLEKVLATLKARRDFVVTPAVNQATLVSADKKYLVIYNKSRTLMESFFTESLTEKALASLKNVDVTVTPCFKFSAVRNLRTGEVPAVVNNKIRLVLPPTDYAVLEFIVPR